MWIVLERAIGFLLVLVASAVWFAVVVKLTINRSKRNLAEPNDSFGNLIMYVVCGLCVASLWGLAETYGFLPTRS